MNSATLNLLPAIIDTTSVANSGYSGYYVELGVTIPAEGYYCLTIPSNKLYNGYYTFNIYSIASACTCYAQDADGSLLLSGAIDTGGNITTTSGTSSMVTITPSSSATTYLTFYNTNSSTLYIEFILNSGQG
jgi:hypothetical protein